MKRFSQFSYQVFTKKNRSTNQRSIKNLSKIIFTFSIKRQLSNIFLTIRLTNKSKIKVNNILSQLTSSTPWIVNVNQFIMSLYSHYSIIEFAIFYFSNLYKILKRKQHAQHDEEIYIQMITNNQMTLNFSKSY